MDKIIPLGEGQFPVSARDLHEFLQVETRFNDWIGRRVHEYGFAVNVDYNPILNSEYADALGKPGTDFMMTLSMAKELSMVERNERGKQARQYFIECEHRLKQVVAVTPIQALQQAVNCMVMLEERVVTTERTLSLVKDTFAARPEEWRVAIKDGVDKIAAATERYHQFVWKEFYDLLEERGHCDLDTRLDHLKARMAERGICKTEIKKANKLDTIIEPALQEVALAIIKEMVAKYAE
jgi:anti-repressor protein